MLCHAGEDDIDRWLQTDGFQSILTALQTEKDIEMAYFVL